MGKHMQIGGVASITSNAGETWKQIQSRTKTCGLTRSNLEEFAHGSKKHTQCPLTLWRVHLSVAVMNQVRNRSRSPRAYVFRLPDVAAQTVGALREQAPRRPRRRMRSIGDSFMMDFENSLLSEWSGAVPQGPRRFAVKAWAAPDSYTHLRAHETVLDLVCRLLLEKKKKNLSPFLFNPFN